MRYRKDRYGNELSQLGFGCMRFTSKGTKIDHAKAEREVLYAIERGVNYFDTAYAYPGSEECLGRILAENNARDKVNVATKLPQYLVRSMKAIDKIFNEELARLQTDHIDYYLMHMFTDISEWERLKSLGMEEWITARNVGMQKNPGFASQCVGCGKCEMHCPQHIQIREMLKNKPPIAIISPGRVYRRDEVDGTHSPIFHQCEGLVIDKNITFADLKGTLEEFAKRLYGEGMNLKFRPHHFPYTEPSCEIDFQCFRCGGKGCPLCKGEGWIEILGAGVVHPKVLENCGIDPEEYSGFAFGIGIERITMLRYEIEDMRLLYENDMRFLKQF